MLRLLTVVLLIGGASMAHAQEPVDALEADTEGEVDEGDLERARRHFQAARTAYDEGRFEDALTEFGTAHELTGNADILYNIATVADRLRRDEVALEAYTEFLEARPGTSDRAHIEGRIRVLRTQVERAREEQRRERDATEAQRREAEQTETAAPGPMGAPHAGPGALPWIVTAAGGAVAVGGGVLLLVAAADVSAVEEPDGEMPRWDDVQDRHERAPTLSAVGGVLLGVGAVAAVSGLAWAILSGGEGEASQVDVAVGPAGIRIRGRL